MNGAHAHPWTEEIEDIDEHAGRVEDKARWDRPDLPPPMPTAAHVSLDPHPDDEPWYMVDRDEPLPELDPRLADAIKPTLTIIVVGSFAWTNRGAVTDALHQLWKDHGQPNIQLVTSGSPAGAEAFARELAVGFGWETATVRDESLGEIVGALVLAFVVPKTIYEPIGIEDLVEWLSHRYWTRIYREETVRQVSPWAKR